MTSNGAPFSDHDDFFAFLRIVEGLGRGDKDFQKRVDDWLESVVAKVAAAGADLEQREALLVQKQSDVANELAGARIAMAAEFESGKKQIKEDRQRMIEAVGKNSAELNGRIAAVALAKKENDETRAELSKMEDEANKVLASANKKQEQYSEMLARIKIARGE